MSKVDLRLLNSIANRIDKKGGPPDDGGMENRIAKLEEFATDAKERLVKIETRLDHIEDRMATKADLHEGFNAMIKWVVGTAAVLGGAAITIMTFVLNNATPKPQQTVQQPPIIINVPSPAAIQPPQIAQPKK